MSARVNHRVGGVILGKVNVVGPAVEGKLEDSRSGNPELVAKCGYIGCDEAQVLCDERQTAKLSLDRAEQFGARAGHPLARLGRRRPGREAAHARGGLVDDVQPDFPAGRRRAADAASAWRQGILRERHDG